VVLFYQALENITVTNAIITPIITVWMLLLLPVFPWVAAPAAEDGVTSSAAEDGVTSSAAEDGAAASAAGDGAGASPIVHWVSSFDETGPVPAGHCWHEFATKNGFNIGFDMKLPAGQHPSRPVDVKLLLDDNDCHSPPHNVRLKPLFLNTEQRIQNC
jgi:hypothetical protein